MAVGRALFAKLCLGLALATILLAGTVAPVVASGQVRWVSDGSRGGPRACRSAPFTSIQAAIDASAARDKVYVCPGTYTEQLDLDVKGILVKSVVDRGATIAAPATLTSADGIVALVRLSNWATRLVGFRIEIPAGSVPPPVAPAVVAACSHVDVAVFITGQHARVRGNRIKATGDATYSGECGYDYGIVFGEHLVYTPVGAFETPATSRAVDNVVRDFKAGGILVEGTGYIARVRGNVIRYYHYNDPCYAPLDAAVTTQTTCAFTAPAVSVNSAFPVSFGIGAEDQALADLRGNSIYSTFDPNVIGLSPTLGWGVGLFGADASSRIRGNRIHHVVTGINVQATPILNVTTDTGPGQYAITAAMIKRNVISYTQTGIAVLDGGHEVYMNASRHNDVGIFVLGDGNYIHDNDFRANTTYACQDTSDPDGGTAGTSNDWQNNLANGLDTPAGICIPVVD